MRTNSASMRSNRLPANACASGSAAAVGSGAAALAIRAAGLEGSTAGASSRRRLAGSAAPPERSASLTAARRAALRSAAGSVAEPRERRSSTWSDSAPSPATALAATNSSSDGARRAWGFACAVTSASVRLASSAHVQNGTGTVACFSPPEVTHALSAACTRCAVVSGRP